jgi:hypothetical protein
MINDNRHNEINIRDVPVENSKYLPVWHRAFGILRAKLLIKNFGNDIALFGTGNNSEELGLNKRKSIMERKKQEVTSDLDEFGSSKKFPCCLIHPNSLLKSFANVILAILLIYTATVMPWRMAFIDSVMWDDWFIAELIIDFLFFLDFIVNCFSAYLDYEGKLVVDRRKIFCEYAKGWMILDLLACFPFGLIEGQ